VREQSVAFGVKSPVLVELIKLMKWKALREAQPAWENNSLGFIEAVFSGNERCHITDAPSA